MNNLTYSGVTITINNVDQIVKKAFVDEGVKMRKVDDNDNNLVILNNENYFIFEDEFIEHSNNLNEIIRKLKAKTYTSNMKVFIPADNIFKQITISGDDLEKYKSIVENNIISNKSNEISFSINILNDILNTSNKSTLIIDILILIFLANKTSYDATTMSAEFTKEDSSFKVDIDLNKTKAKKLYPLYNWIVNDNEYNESYIIKLQIVRETIINKQQLSDIQDILKDSKLIYKRIISNKTEEYFEQINKLKDDFLILSRNENNILRTLNLTFFTWVGTLSIQIFNIVKDYDNNDIINYLLYSKSEKTTLIIIIFLISLIYIFLMYSAEIFHLKKEYKVIKKIYEDKILFDSSDSDGSKFEDIIKEPKIGIIQTIIFILLIFILILRL